MKVFEALSERLGARHAGVTLETSTGIWHHGITPFLQKYLKIM